MVLQTSKYILLISLASFSQAKTVQLTNLAPKPGVYLPNLARSLEYTNFGHEEGIPSSSSRQKRFTSFRYRPECKNISLINVFSRLFENTQLTGLTTRLQRRLYGIHTVRTVPYSQSPCNCKLVSFFANHLISH